MKAAPQKPQTFPYWAVASAILVLLVLRRPDALLNPQFWAEDGPIYFAQALIYGPSTILWSYAGCLWILPRIVAVAVTLLPALWAPFAFNLIALVVDAACCALFSLPAYRHLVRSDWLRLGSCLLFAATLCNGSELIGTLTNMPWYMALAAVGAVALQPESVAEMRARSLSWIAGGAALCAISSPVVIVLAPVALWQTYHAARARRWQSLAIPAALLAGILVQGMVNFRFLAGRGFSNVAIFPNFPLALLFLGLLSPTLSEGLSQYLADRHIWSTAIGASLLIVAFLILLGRRLKMSVLLSALLLIVGPVALAIAGRHTVWATSARILQWSGQRYFLLPACALIFLLAAWLDTFPNFRWSLVALMLPFVLGIAGNFRVPPYPDYSWPIQAHRVQRWMATGCDASIPIPPESWTLDLPNFAPKESPCRMAVWLSAKAIDAARVGPVIHISEWKADPAWTRNGFHRSIGTLAGETLWGSHSGSDANQGTLTSAPFDTNLAGCIVLPVAHGPSTRGQSVRLIAADSGQDLGEIRLDQNLGTWQYWAIDFSHNVSRLQIVAADEGSQFGEWLAIGEPHTCR